MRSATRTVLTVTAAVASIAFALANVAQAAIITPTAATQTSSFDATRNVTETINGSGLTGGGDTNVTEPWTGSGNILAAVHSDGSLNDHVYLGNVSGQVLTYTLPGATDLTAVHIWNYTHSQTGQNFFRRGVNTAAFSFSTNGGSTYGSPITLTFDLVSIGSPSLSQTRSFGTTLLGVTNVRLSNMTNHGGSQTLIGLGEIRFESAEPEIAVSGNSLDIVDGDPTPSLADFTDFGITTVGSPIQHTFRVDNTGTASLTTSGLTLPSGFSLFEPLRGSIAAGGFDTFTVQLDALAAGLYSGQISFTNNDSNESPFSFSIAGEVVSVVPEPNAFVLSILGILSALAVQRILGNR